MKIHITDFGDSLLWIMDAEEIGLDSPPFCITSNFEVIDEKKFFLAVLKYGIKFQPERVSETTL
jgi:hypothetical protein